MIKKDTKVKKMHVRSGDTVVVICGKDRGKRGNIMAVSPKEGKVIVSGINMVSKHVKARRENEEGGIIKAPSAFYSCKVQLVCSSCDRPTRVAHVFSENGKKQRICKKCNCAI
jgi:large subunit ribosomal protein L24